MSEKNSTFALPKRNMQERLRFFIRYYVFWVLFFMAQKPLFMLCQHRLTGDIQWSDWFLVPWHGLPLDLSVAAYLTAVAGVLLCLSVWMNVRIVATVIHIVTAVFILLSLLVIIGDIASFPSWGYHIDKDVFDYLASPQEVWACAPWWIWTIGFVVVAVLFVLWWLLYRHVVAMPLQSVEKTSTKIGLTAVLVGLTALLFLPMRGSVTVSTMNTGRVYYSDNRMINLAAVNPVFNLVESLSENTFDSSRYRYMPSAEAAALLHAIRPDTGKPMAQLLTTDRPHIVLIILESFGKCAWDAMPNMQKYAQEGVYFSNVYANSFRTDRGVMAVLGAFPGCATTSVMMVPSKTQQLPQIGQVLKANGYDLKFYYGGDEDFTNMRSYLITGGFDNRVCDHDFSISDRLSKWGVPDHILFDFASHDILKRHQGAQPCFDVVLSLSSHEPFEVNYHHLDHPYLNAVAYTDSCVGAFVETLKQQEQWQNTVVVLTADHGYPYPDNLLNYDTLRYEMPLVMVGGAIREAKTITTLGSQIDWVPTMLHQMRLDAEDFCFAKDLTDTTRMQYAYYHFVDGFAFKTRRGTTIIDAVINTPVVDTASDSLQTKQACAITQQVMELLYRL